MIKKIIKNRWRGEIFMKIMEFIKNIHAIYLIINILGFIVLSLYLKSKGAPQKKKIIGLIAYLLISILIFPYMNGVTKEIFQLRFLSVKIYLIVIIVTNMIILVTINKPIKLGYKIANYLLFILLTIILGATAAVVLGNRFESFYIMDVGNAVNFIDLSLVLFMLYLIVISLIYIGYYLFDEKKDEVEDRIDETLEKVKTLPKANWHFSFQEALPFKNMIKKSKNHQSENRTTKVLSADELLNYNLKEGFYIHGVECSIIFEDSQKENIVKNYHILLNDIHAHLVNGYTLEENKMLKDICMKLQVGNLNSINLQNAAILNRVSVEEYNLLKKIF